MVVAVSVGVLEGGSVRVGEASGVNGAEVARIVFVGCVVMVIGTFSVGSSSAMPEKSDCVQCQPSPKKKKVAINKTAIKPQKMTGLIGLRAAFGFWAALGFVGVGAFLVFLAFCLLVFGALLFFGGRLGLGGLLFFLDFFVGFVIFCFLGALAFCVSLSDFDSQNFHVHCVFLWAFMFSGRVLGAFCLKTGQ